MLYNSRTVYLISILFSHSLNPFREEKVNIDIPKIALSKSRTQALKKMRGIGNIGFFRRSEGFIAKFLGSLDFCYFVSRQSKKCKIPN